MGTFTSMFGHSVFHSSRLSQTPIFGQNTIRRFPANVSGMKRLAARDFEDILQVSSISRTSRNKHLIRWCIISSALFQPLRAYSLKSTTRSYPSFFLRCAPGMRLPNYGFTRNLRLMPFRLSHRYLANNFVTSTQWCAQHSKPGRRQESWKLVLGVR